MPPIIIISGLLGC